VLILWPVAGQQKEPYGRQTLDQAVEQRLGLGIDPVQIFEQDQERLHQALPEDQPLDAVQGPLATLGRVEPRPLRILDWNI